MIEAADLKGVYTALVTPFNHDGSLDIGALRRLCEFQISAGVAGLVPIGGTGEYVALSVEERYQVVETCIEVSNGRVLVMPGVLSPGFKDAHEIGKHFFELGVDALMLLTPYYTAGTQEGIADYFRGYRDAVDCPLILYEIPGKTNISMQAETILSLVESGTIIGMKYSSYDVAEFIRVAALCADKLALMSGEEPLFATHVAIGASAGIMTTSNLLPEKWLAIYSAAASGNLKYALTLQAEMDPLIQVAFSDGNPGPMKEILKVGGIECGAPRLPLVSPNDVKRKEIVSVLTKMNRVRSVEAPTR